MKRLFNGLKAFVSSWTGTIIIVLFLIFFVMQAFVIPTRSMVGTLYEGDFLFVKKFSYGIPTPRIPWVEINILPDFRGNGHLFEGERPKRGDVVVFIPPHEQKVYYVKRTFAVGGDEVIFDKDGMYLRPFEGDEYIREHYSADIIVERFGKKFVKNPYMSQHPGIAYESVYYENPYSQSHYKADEQGKLYERVCVEGVGHANMGDGELGCELWKREYISDTDGLIEDSNVAFTDMFNDRTIRSMEKYDDMFYIKIKQDEFFMVGDNRNNSFDSRFWGSVPYKNIIGKPWFIYLSLNKANSEETGADIDKSRRYTIRWDRMFRTTEGLEQKIKEAMPK